MNTNSVVTVLCLVLSIVVAMDSNNIPKKPRNNRKYIPQWKYCLSKPVDKLALCNSTSKYPDTAILKLLRRNKVSTAGKVVVEPVSDADILIAKEKGPESAPQNICRTRTYTVFPKMAMDVNTHELRYIVNVKNQFEQAIIYETCVDPDSSCMGMNEDILPAGMKTRCVQKYTSVRLTAVNGRGNLDYGNFLVPSTCVCSFFDYSVWSL